MAEITVQDLPFAAGLTPAFTAVTVADSFRDDGLERTFFKVRNASAGNRVVTILARQTSAPVSGVARLTVADIVTTVAAGAERLYGPFPSSYIDKDGFVQITFNSAASTTISVIRVPRDYN